MDAFEAGLPLGIRIRGDDDEGRDRQRMGPLLGGCEISAGILDKLARRLREESSGEGRGCSGRGASLSETQLSGRLLLLGGATRLRQASAAARASAVPSLRSSLSLSCSLSSPLLSYPFFSLIHPSWPAAIRARDAARRACSAGYMLCCGAEQDLRHSCGSPRRTRSSTCRA